MIAMICLQSDLTMIRYSNDDADDPIIRLQAKDLIKLREAQRPLQDTTRELRSSLAPQFARINRGLQVRSRSCEGLHARLQPPAHTGMAILEHATCSCVFW